MSLLRSQKTWNLQPSPDAQSSSPNVPASLVQLTSPSTTALLTPTTAMRNSPGHSQVTLSRQQPSLRGPSPDQDERDMDEPESPLVEPLTPLSPPGSPSPSRHVHYRSSVSTVSDLVEELSLEPYQRWSADRRLGLTLEERVQREFERRNTTEAREAFGIVSRSPLMQAESSSSMPSTPPSSPGPTAQARRCSHCGSVRPLECGDTQTINEHSSDDERDLEDNPDEDEDDFSAARRSSPLPFARGRGAGRSPYLHPAPKMHARGRFHSHSPEPGSPASPLSPSVSFSKMPSAWASTVTLSLANALGPHKGSSGSSSASSSGQASTSASGASASGSSGSGLKRKESFGVKKLFGSLKGKERERESKQREREYAALPPPSASVSSSDSSTESVDGWEVVSGGDSDGGHSSSSASTTPSSPSTYPSPSRSTHEAGPSSPTTESARAAAFLNRPVRHRPPPLPLDSPASTPSSPHPLSSPASPALTHAAAPSPVSASARPYLPAKSPLRLIASANHLRQAHAPVLSSLVSRLMAESPKTLRGSPSVVWKPAPASAAAQASPVQRSPLWQGMYQQPVSAVSQTRAPPPHPPHPQFQSQRLSQPPRVRVMLPFTRPSFLI
ncbi:hypothetical protein PYCCODRAFT_320343 [Trametes coccinea BRFM310]|uniref:Uncharacterized protein n=1 Tax=Trametes coccinea (strain BRFM310) TaxID=1353009 RepID=A0A1Y2IPF0_TRAC3|nr:hypothetical protein PYCCODRAFT_320343 [Trametes coccinea BRFM310]